MAEEVPEEVETDEVVTAVVEEVAAAVAPVEAARTAMSCPQTRSRRRWRSRQVRMRSRMMRQCTHYQMQRKTAPRSSPECRSACLDRMVRPSWAQSQ